MMTDHNFYSHLSIECHSLTQMSVKYFETKWEYGGRCRDRSLELHVRKDFSGRPAKSEASIGYQGKFWKIADGRGSFLLRCKGSKGCRREEALAWERQHNWVMSYEPTKHPQRGFLSAFHKGLIALSKDSLTRVIFTSRFFPIWR